MHQRQIQLFWKLDFYTAPILLEKVTGNQLSGFCIDTDQRTITFCQPWTQILRSCRGSGASRNIKSGITARVRLILHNVWPSHVRDAQIQDFVGLAFSQFPSLFNSSFREQLVTLCRSFHCRLSHHEIFRFAKGEKPFCGCMCINHVGGHKRIFLVRNPALFVQGLRSQSDTQLVRGPVNVI